jgi:energy-coupling factor transporter ATP-binding protein EcfA2
VDSIALLHDRRLAEPFARAEMAAHMPQLIASGVLYPPSHWPDLRCHLPLGGGAPAVRITDLRFGYDQTEEVLHGISLEVPQGQFLAVIGANGAGKSTLVRHLNGLLRPTAGTVKILGEPIGDRPTGVVAHNVGFLFQRPEQQLFAPTVRDEVAYGPHHLGLRDVGGRVTAVLAQFGLSEVADLPPAVLGYGMQRAVTLASLAALETPIVVLDEPTVGLDGRGLAQLLDWMARLRKRGATLVVVTHELPLAARADRVLVLEQGRVVADGPPQGVLSGDAQ